MSINSGESINIAKSAYDNLSENNKEKVKNYTALEKAITVFDQKCSEFVDIAYETLARDKEPKALLETMEPYAEHSEKIAAAMTDIKSYLYEGTYYLKPTYEHPYLEELLVFNTQDGKYVSYTYRVQDKTQSVLPPIDEYLKYLKGVLSYTNVIDDHNGNVLYYFIDREGNDYQFFVHKYQGEYVMSMYIPLTAMVNQG